MPWRSTPRAEIDVVSVSIVIGAPLPPLPPLPPVAPVPAPIAWPPCPPLPPLESATTPGPLLTIDVATWLSRVVTKVMADPPDAGPPYPPRPPAVPYACADEVRDESSRSPPPLPPEAMIITAAGASEVPVYGVALITLPTGASVMLPPRPPRPFVPLDP